MKAAPRPLVFAVPPPAKAAPAKAAPVTPVDLRVRLDQQEKVTEWFRQGLITREYFFELTNAIQNQK